MRKTSRSKFALVFSTALLGALTGCVGYVEEPHARVYAPAPAVQVEVGVVDDYVYYPGYEVYYSSSRRQYVYMEGRSWVSRQAPPRVSADVLFASPSVRLDFHDSPANHHSSVVRQYPKQWAPPESNRDKKDGRGEGHNERNDQGRKDHD